MRNTIITQWGKKTVLSTLIAAKAAGIPIPTAHSLKLMNIGFEGGVAQQGLSICPYKSGYPAASCISIDFEHLHDNSSHNNLNSRGTKATLELADQFGIPLTWAICGEAAVKDREAYEQILRSKVKQDIGVHTYSHLDLADSRRTETDVLSDISKCIDLLDSSERPVSFIFPYNREDHFESLRRLGFVAYRSKERVFGYPQKKDGLWCIPPVYYIDEVSGDFETAKRFIDFAIANGCVFHMWFHPRSIALDGDIEAYVATVLKPIFRYISEKRREGNLWVCTMRELANYCEARENCTITSKKEDGRIRLDVKCVIRDPRFDHPPQVTIKIPISEGGTIVRVDGETTLNTKVSASKQGLHLFLPLTFDEPVRHIEITPPSSIVSAAS
ncbi:MAG: polysaccharide deacetylase family protein [Nitrososphaerales archaeon]